MLDNSVTLTLPDLSHPLLAVSKSSSSQSQTNLRVTPGRDGAAWRGVTFARVSCPPRLPSARRPRVPSEERARERDEGRRTTRARIICWDGGSVGHAMGHWRRRAWPSKGGRAARQGAADIGCCCLPLPNSSTLRAWRRLVPYLTLPPFILLSLTPPHPTYPFRPDLTMLRNLASRSTVPARVSATALRPTGLQHCGVALRGLS